MNELSVSVIIPTYNRANLIVRSLRSVLAATAAGDEITVVDDGSTDDTEEALVPYRDRIRYISLPRCGVGPARNCGIALATNPLVAFNDSDDEWFPDKLILRRAFMQARPDVLFCFTDLGLKDRGGNESHHGLFGWHHDSRSWDEILGPGLSYSTLAPLPTDRKDFKVHIGNLYEAMLRINYVPTQATVVRRAEAGEALHFGEDISIHEDHECFVRLSKIGRAAYFDCETVWQCDHSGSRLTQVDTFYSATCRIKMLERTFGTDQQFLARRSESYWEMLKAEYLTRTRYLIRKGLGKEARKELEKVEGGPLPYRLLASVPGPMLRVMFILYQCMIDIIHSMRE